MTQRKTSVILIGAGLVAVVLVITVALLMDRQAPSRKAVPVGQATPARPTSLSPVGAGPTGARGDTRLATIPEPRLTVVAVSPGGLPVHAAQIVISGPGGSQEATGRGEWDDLELGTWTVDITSDGYLDVHEEVTLTDGAQPELVLTLHRSVEVRGRIMDRLGSPVPTEVVWFLPAETDAQSRREYRRAPRAVTGVTGSFEIKLAQAGDYRLTVGPSAQPRLTMESPVHLEPGLQEVDIVVPGGGTVELEVSSLPDLASAREGALQARVYARRATDHEETGADPTSPRRGRKDPRIELPDPSTIARRRAEAGKATDGDSPKPISIGGGKARRDDPQTTTGAPLGEITPDPLGVDPMGAEWVHKVSVPVGPDGKASFLRLSARQEYRLVLEVRRVRYESTQSFRVDADRLVSLRTSLPPLPAPGGGRRRQPLVRALDVFVNARPPGSDIPDPGFHWK